MSSTFYFDSVLHLYLMKGSDHFILKYYSLSLIFVTHTALISIFCCCIHTHIINRKKYRTIFMVLIDGQDLHGKTITSYLLVLINIVFVIRFTFARKHIHLSTHLVWWKN